MIFFFFFFFAKNLNEEKIFCCVFFSPWGRAEGPRASNFFKKKKNPNLIFFYQESKSKIKNGCWGGAGVSEFFLQ